MIEFTCRRCSGRRSLAEDNGAKCYVCLGEGTIRVYVKDVKDQYSQKPKSRK
jgi:hypothetical protein